jgi:hypothetical protein
MFTWSDVEKALIQWIKDNQIAEQLDKLYRLDVEREELALLHTLQRKHSHQDVLPQVDTVSPAFVEIPVSRSAGYQLSFFEP